MTDLRNLFLAALIAGSTANSAAGQVTLGVKAGASASELVFTGVELRNHESRRGVGAGASVTLPVWGSLGLRLEGAYAQKGATASDIQLGTISYRLDYVQLSVLGKLTVPMGSPWVSLHLLAGPAAGWETGCEAEFTFALQPVTMTGQCDDEWLDTPSKSLDYGVVGGVGAQLRVTEWVGFSLDFLYTYGLRSVYGGMLDRTVRNRAMTVQAGVVFPVGAR